MGNYASGILAFGFPVGSFEDEDVPEWMTYLEEEWDGDFDDFVCEVSDRAFGTDVMTDPVGVQQIIDSCPARIIYYGSDEYLQHFLLLKGFHHIASFGDAEAITSDKLEVSAEEIAAFKKWCEAANIPYETPRWWLLAHYG